jgi:hypothetical protein
VCDVYVEDISRGIGLGNHQYMSCGLREKVHECQNTGIFVDPDCERLLAQYLRESVFVVINAVQAHHVPSAAMADHWTFVYSAFAALN